MNLQRPNPFRQDRVVHGILFGESEIDDFDASLWMVALKHDVFTLVWCDKTESIRSELSDNQNGPKCFGLDSEHSVLTI